MASSLSRLLSSSSTSSVTSSTVPSDKIIINFLLNDTEIKMNDNDNYNKLYNITIKFIVDSSFDYANKNHHIDTAGIEKAITRLDYFSSNRIQKDEKSLNKFIEFFVFLGKIEQDFIVNNERHGILLRYNSTTISILFEPANRHILLRDWSIEEQYEFTSVNKLIKHLLISEIWGDSKYSYNYINSETKVDNFSVIHLHSTHTNSIVMNNYIDTLPLSNKINNDELFGKLDFVSEYTQKSYIEELVSKKKTSLVPEQSSYLCMPFSLVTIYEFMNNNKNDPAEVINHEKIFPDSITLYKPPSSTKLMNFSDLGVAITNMSGSRYKDINKYTTFPKNADDFSGKFYKSHSGLSELFEYLQTLFIKKMKQKFGVLVLNGSLGRAIMVDLTGKYPAIYLRDSHIPDQYSFVSLVHLLKHILTSDVWNDGTYEYFYNNPIETLLFTSTGAIDFASSGETAGTSTMTKSISYTPDELIDEISRTLTTELAKGKYTSDKMNRMIINRSTRLRNKDKMPINDLINIIKRINGNVTKIISDDTTITNKSLWELDVNTLSNIIGSRINEINDSLIDNLNLSNQIAQEFKNNLNVIKRSMSGGNNSNKDPYYKLYLKYKRKYVNTKRIYENKKRITS